MLTDRSTHIGDELKELVSYFNMKKTMERCSRRTKHRSVVRLSWTMQNRSKREKFPPPKWCQINNFSGKKE